MLALVHPLQHPDPVHRQPPSARSSRPIARRPQSTSSLPLPSSSRTSNVAQPPPPRHPTAPSSALSFKQPDPQPTALPKPTPTFHSSSFDVHSYPSQELLRLLASLLTQIAATNDQLSPSSPTATSPHSTHTSFSDLESHPPVWRTLTTASRSALGTPSSTLTFHARNIPTITLEAYLLRILKYCPTTNEVFLSLLVYFDRMSKLANEATGKTFVIDSYNIHRLVIAGVTVASKFFSDVFYTNSRYAKVGGLPQTELNQLELQFLLLNDFRLVISGDEMQRYAEQLIIFSQSETSPAPHVPPLTTSTPSAPMQAMGAIDAYGGRIPSDDHDAFSYRPSRAPTQQQGPSYLATNGSSNNNHSTPNVRPRWPYEDAEDDEDDEREADAGNETETDGGETTDDEPTIRPPHSSASSETDNRSLCSTSTVESEDDEGVEVEVEVEVEGAREMDVEDGDGHGERTPERVGRGRSGSVGIDERMESP